MIGYCPHCGIRLDLHDDPDDCTDAERRVFALRQLEEMLTLPWDAA